MYNNFKLAIFFVFVSYFFFQKSYAQRFGGNIEYSLFIGDDDKIAGTELEKYLNSAKENAKNVQFILEFNTSSMIFQLKDKMYDPNTNFSVAFSGVNGIYFKRKGEQNLIHAIENPSIGRVVFNEELKTDWTLSNETKYIQNFKCFKATSIEKFNNGVGDFEDRIIAWYCPEIPFPFGPNGYSLPGMILELQRKNNIIGATKINFSEKEININPPTGKILSQKEYQNKLDEFFKNQD